MYNNNFEVFISYSRKDSEVASRICQALDEAGISYFIDRQSINGGSEFPDIIASAIMQCHVFLFLASENSYNSQYTGCEVNFAFSELREKKIVMLPYIIDDSIMPPKFRLVFSNINWRNMSDHPIHPTLINDLIGQLSQFKVQPIKEPQISQGSAIDPNDFNHILANNGDMVAQYNLGLIYESEDTQTSHFWLLKSAEQGYAKAQASLADDYFQKKEYSEAMKWWLKASEQGCAEASCNIGLLYGNGLGVERDFEESFKWTKKAAEQGLPVAQFNLGWLYDKGKGVPEDNEKAVCWYLKALSNGADCDFSFLGVHYELGTGGLDVDINRAVELYKQSASKGYDSGQYQLGRIYCHGIGVEKNPKLGCEWYQKAANQGYLTAIQNLGVMYAQAQGVPRDYSAALRLFELGASRGSEDCMFNAAFLYENGMGAEKNLNRAIDLYLEAARREHRPSIDRLMSVYKK